MTVASRGARVQRARTYSPAQDEAELVAGVVRQLEALANRQATLRSADGDEVLLPDQLFDVLARVATALASGQSVTVIPRESRLTTQQAADILGVSRPTLTKLLDQGDLAHERIGGHRRVLMRDLEEYRERMRAERRAVLRRMSRDGQAAGALELSADDLPERV